MADLTELRCERAAIEEQLAPERPRAEAERCFLVLSLDPGVFGGAGRRVHDLEARATKLDTMIAAAEAEAAAHEFVSSAREFIRLGRLEHELDRAIERAEAELSSAMRDGAEAVEWKRRYDTPNGFAHLGYQGADHRTPGPEIMPVPDDIRSQLQRIGDADRELKLLRARRVSEAAIPRQNLAQRFPALHSLSLDLDLVNA